MRGTRQGGMCQHRTSVVVLISSLGFGHGTALSCIDVIINTKTLAERLVSQCMHQESIKPASIYHGQKYSTLHEPANQLQHDAYLEPW